MADDGGAGVFSFEGRINRGTFWKITLLSLVIIVLLGMGAAVAIPMLAGSTASAPGDAGSSTAGMVALALAVVVYGTGIWVSLATQAKRWHDLGKSAWYILLNVIPIVGLLAFLYIGFAPGNDGQNQFGSAPQ